MTTDVSWWPRAVQQIDRGDLAAAEAEIGAYRLEVLLNALQTGRGPMDIFPGPGEAGWEEYLGYMLDPNPPSPAPCSKHDEGTTVTMTEVWGDEDCLPPFFPGRR